MNKLAVVVLAAGLSLAACAPEPGGQQSAPQQPAAQPGAQSASEPTFEVADSNKDGKISRDEASIVQGLDFGAADANSDSTLDPLEYTVAIAEISRLRG